eukprot:Nitzschia sp. Nitz4//scaffold193_size40683//1159//5990//NITZ4_007493-RA/size40683-processed-gene-0.9-mRNA-1//1//CDS//3329540261//1531//frame0
MLHSVSKAKKMISTFAGPIDAHCVAANCYPAEFEQKFSVARDEADLSVNSSDSKKSSACSSDEPEIVFVSGVVELQEPNVAKPPPCSLWSLLLFFSCITFGSLLAACFALGIFSEFRRHPNSTALSSKSVYYERLLEFVDLPLDPGSAQAQALEWLAFEDVPTTDSTDAEILQRLALTVLYFEQGGPSLWGTINLDEQAGWVEHGMGIHECYWRGVDCNESLDIIGLRLGSGIGITMAGSSITTELGALSKLELLDLSSHRLHGQIPAEWEALTRLMVLDLSNNGMRTSVPRWFGNLSNLQSLLLNHNQLTGTLPDSIGRLTALKSLQLQHNAELRGRLHEFIPLLSRLEDIDISTTSIGGTIPGNNTSFGHSLEEFRAIAVPELEGSIPPSISKWTNLRKFAIGLAPQLTGTIPTSFGLLTRLGELQITSTDWLTGTIPSELGLLQAMTILELDWSNREGKLPSTLGKLSNLVKLSLDHNHRITGSIPTEFGMMSSLTFMGGSLSFKGDKKSKKKSKKAKHKLEKESKEETVNDEELTEAERKALQRRQERQRKENEEIAQKSHRERVEELNEKLGSLTEHNDIPRREQRMSHRAIARLRQEREFLHVSAEDDEESEESDEPAPKRGFAFMMDDSDEESSDEESEEDASCGNDSNVDSDDSEPVQTSAAPDDAVELPDDSTPDDFDALLEEFKAQDIEVEDAPDHKVNTYYKSLRATIDPRDLDVGYVMRTALMGAADDTTSSRNNTRRGRQASVFGPPKENWSKPPHYVGGGIGMTTCDNGPTSASLPWPYEEMAEDDPRCPEVGRWFRFQYSDNYKRDLHDFKRIQASGDPNALALFIAHHPYIVEALLQLSAVLYQTNQSQEGLALLQRALYVYESASINSFLKFDGQSVFMDHEDPTNALFFAALFRLVRVCHVGGDPMGILLALDHFALVSNIEANDRWLVDFVDSQRVNIYYKDESNPDGYVSSLLDLPNWAYSFALALFRVHNEAPTEESEARADASLQEAINKFPSILEALLIKNDVNVRERSFRHDWPTVLGYTRERTESVKGKLFNATETDAVVKSCTSQACDLISRTFVEQNHKLWASDSVLSWIYKNLKVLEKVSTEVIAPSPAMMRYASSKASDYEDKFETMPADANPLDPGLVAHAMVVDVNRPRFMQRVHRGGGQQEQLQMMDNNLQAGHFAGPPTEIVDPDWPILEVFWRSALPWAHVEGVPPPGR